MVIQCLLHTSGIYQMLQWLRKKAMSLRKKFGTDANAIENGVWLDVCENDDGSTGQIRIKRMNGQNTQFQKQLANHRKAFAGGGNHLSERKLSQMENSMIGVITDTIIVGLKNIPDWRVEQTNKASTEEFPTPLVMLEFNKSNVRAMLEEFPDLADLITEEAQNLANFQSADREAEGKN